MKEKVCGFIPHILFILLLVLILTPSLEETETFWPFLLVIIASEIAFLANRKKNEVKYIAIIVFAFLFIWEFVINKTSGPHSILFPAPENVFAVYITDYPKILSGILSSLTLLLESFFLAIVLGVGLGFIVGISDSLTDIIMPIVKVISPIPSTVYTPYAVRLLPSFTAASIFVITLTIFWGLFMNMVISVRQIDKKLMDSAKTLNLSKKTLIFNILLPYSVPRIMNSLEVSISTSFLVLTAAEMLGADSGLGWYIKYHSDFANYPKLVAGIITIGVVVTLLNVLVKLLRKVLVKWQ